MCRHAYDTQGFCNVCGTKKPEYESPFTESWELDEHGMIKSSQPTPYERRDVRDKLADFTFGEKLSLEELRLRHIIENLS